MNFTSPNWQWLHAIEVLAVDGDYEAQTADEETLVVLLSGTYDILAGGGSWLARGVRSSPLDARPVALFLPPQTRFAFHNGHGELLLVTGRQPEKAADENQGTSHKPLLALAGSGKAFDPASGEWKRQEDFPSSPEAILPRRIETHSSDGCELRQVFPFDYKALSLCLDELVLRAGHHTTVAASGIAGYPRERALYYDTTATLRIGEHSLRGRGVLPDLAAGTQLQALDGDTHLAIISAGPKL